MILNFDNKFRDIELILYKREIITEIQTLKTKSIEIEKALNFTKSIVLIILQKNSIRKNDVNKLRNDKFNMFSNRDRRYIIKHVHLNFRIIYAQLKIEAEIFCFKFTFYRTFKLYELIN